MSSELPGKPRYQRLGACSCGARHDGTSVDDCLRDGVVDGFLAGMLPDPSRRRAFLSTVRRNAATAAISSLLPLSSLTALAQGASAPPEKPKLQIGFLPIACATPLIYADQLGLFTRAGLDVSLQKVAGIGLIREKMINGELDVSQQVMPVALSMSLGAGSIKVPARVLTVLSQHGNSLVLAMKHKDNRDPRNWKGFRFALPFEQSQQMLLLRHYLSSFGLDPERDVSYRVVAPSEYVSNLRVGNVDGGAYGAGLAALRLGFGLAPAALVGAGLAAVFALLFGALWVRRSKVYFAMLTLAFSQLVWAVAFRWNSLTGGDQGINGLPMPQFNGLLGWTNQRWFFWACLALLCAALFLLHRLTRASFGSVLNAATLNPERVQFLGTSVPAVQLAAFVIAGTLAGLAGALFAFHTRGLLPDYLFWTKGAEALNMVVLGGMNHLLGPVVGAATLLLINQEATAFTEYWSAATGVMLGALILFAPSGLTGGLERLLSFLRSSPSRQEGANGSDDVPAERGSPR